MQTETALESNIEIPCPKCGGHYFTSKEPDTTLQKE